MKQEKLAPEPVIRVYLAVLREAVLNLRMRIRYEEKVDIKEVHDLLDSLHNIPEMICGYGGWHVEANIDEDLARYDERWSTTNGKLVPLSLMASLQNQKSLVMPKE